MCHYEQGSVLGAGNRTRSTVVLAHWGEMQLAGDKYISEIISSSVKCSEESNRSCAGHGWVVIDDNHVSCTSTVFLDE